MLSQTCFNLLPNAEGFEVGTYREVLPGHSSRPQWLCEERKLLAEDRKATKDKIKLEVLFSDGLYNRNYRNTKSFEDDLWAVDIFDDNLNQMISHVFYNSIGDLGPTKVKNIN